MSGENLLVVLFVVLGATLLIAGIAYGREFLVNARQPLRSRIASVVARRVQEEQGTGWSPAMLYIVTFQLPDGNMLELSVPEQDYSHLPQGEQGTLKTRGNWYRGFDSRTV